MRYLFILLICSFAVLSRAQESTPEAAILGGGIGELAIRSGSGAAAVIYLMNVDGSNPREILAAPYAEWLIEWRWSPDGSEILFTTQVEGDWNMYLMDADGSNLRPVLENETEENWAIWSPDGSQILYTTNIDASKGLYLFNRDGTGSQRILESNAAVFLFDWQASGDWIAYSRNVQGGLTEIYLTDLEGEALRFTEWNGQDFYPRWSPDGGRLAWLSDRAGYAQVYLVDFESALQEVPLGDSSLISLASDLRRVGTFSWSPDGQYIALTSNTHPTELDNDVFIVNLETGESQKITDNSASTILGWH